MCNVCICSYSFIKQLNYAHTIEHIQPNLSNPTLNGSHKVCWIKEVVGLSSHLCNSTLHNIKNYAVNYM